jgi:hypothetical protein
MVRYGQSAEEQARPASLDLSVYKVSLPPAQASSFGLSLAMNAVCCPPAETTMTSKLSISLDLEHIILTVSQLQFNLSN